MTHPNQLLADLLFPEIDKTPSYWLEKYPPRQLPEGAYVTRFAPSPTGFVHIGSIMASLVSRRIAHQTGGKFLLRIEDTDKKREQDGSIEAIVNNLNNFGLTPDEGFVQVNPEVERGDYAPYTQSDRAEIYATFVKDLVARGLAYPCFATEAELDENRKLQEAQRIKPGYYGPFAKWRNASLEKVQERLDVGDRPVIRLRAPYPIETRIQFQDAIRGEMDMPANDQDIVLLKSSNRLPTYHLAHLVDDILMRVNLVVRGEEWLPSAPIHVQIHEYIQHPLPLYAHIAPIAKMDGGSKRKISKRKDPEANVAYYYAQGYPVQAVTEYLLNLTNSSFYEWRQANPTAPHTDFVVRFDNMQVSSALFDIIKLNDTSKDVIASYTAEEIYAQALDWAKEYQPTLVELLEADQAYTLKVFNVERAGPSPRKDIINWSDIERACGFFFDSYFEDAVNRLGYPFSEKLDQDTIRQLIEYASKFDPAQSKEDWLAGMRTFSAEIGFAPDNKSFKKNPELFKGTFGDMMMVIRVALTGKTNTPDLYEMMQTMGVDRVQSRFARASASL